MDDSANFQSAVLVKVAFNSQLTTIAKDSRSLKLSTLPASRVTGREG